MGNEELLRDKMKYLVPTYNSVKDDIKSNIKK